MKKVIQIIAMLGAMATVSQAHALALRVDTTSASANCAAVPLGPFLPTIAQCFGTGASSVVSAAPNNIDVPSAQFGVLTTHTTFDGVGVTYDVTDDIPGNSFVAFVEVVLNNNGEVWPGYTLSVSTNSNTANNATIVPTPLFGDTSDGTGGDLTLTAQLTSPTLLDVTGAVPDPDGVKSNNLPTAPGSSLFNAIPSLVDLDASGLAGGFVLFYQLDLNGLNPGDQITISSNGISPAATPAPEPQVALLLGLGLLAVVASGIRRRAAR